MSLILECVLKVTNGQTHICVTDLELQSGTMNVLLGPTYLMTHKTATSSLPALLFLPFP